MHHFRATFVSNNELTIYMDGQMETVSYNVLPGMTQWYVTCELNNITIVIEERAGNMMSIEFISDNLRPTYFTKLTDCEFLLNDDWAVLSKCYGAIVSFSYVLDDLVPNQEFTNTSDQYSAPVVYERYECGIFMRILEIRYWDYGSPGSAGCREWNRYGKYTDTFGLTFPITTAITYDHGTITTNYT